MEGCTAYHYHLKAEQLILGLLQEDRLLLITPPSSLILLRNAHTDEDSVGLSSVSSLREKGKRSSSQVYSFIVQLWCQKHKVTRRLCLPFSLSRLWVRVMSRRHPLGEEDGADAGIRTGPVPPGRMVSGQASCPQHPEWWALQLKQCGVKEMSLFNVESIKSRYEF